MTTAVVGAGPNGLAAAIHLARHGVDGQVLEARDTVGGGVRSGELTVPGVIHGHCSATHPFGVGSPFWKEIDLQSYGPVWKWPEIDCAHSLDDGTAGVLYRSIEATAARGDPVHAAESRHPRAVRLPRRRPSAAVAAQATRPLTRVHPDIISVRSLLKPAAAAAVIPARLPGRQC